MKSRSCATSCASPSPSVQQKLETRIQESSEFLKRINIIGVSEQTGEKLGLGVSGTIASRTDKRTMLGDFDAYLDGVLQADAGGQDVVVGTLLVWHIDVGNFARALTLAEYALRHAVALPDQYQRTLPTLLLDEVSEAAIAGKLTGPDALAYLAKVDMLTHDHDAHDQARAKLHKAIGWACMGKTSTNDADPKDLPPDVAGIALKHLRRAMELNDKVGVKKDIERLERAVDQLKKADSPPNDGGPDKGASA